MRRVNSPNPQGFVARTNPVGEMGIFGVSDSLGRVAAAWPRAVCGAPADFLRRWINLLATTLVPLVATLAPAGAETASAMRAEAMDLCRFALFVDWPANDFKSARDALTVCVLQNDPLAPMVAREVVGKTASGRPLAARVVDATAAVADCRVLFMGSRDRGRREVARRLDGRSILFVSDSAYEPPLHPMIVFVVERDRVQFNIDKAAAARAHLVVSSKLLAMARTTNPGPSP